MRSGKVSALLLTLVLIVVAGFESSTYVGGVTFAIAALAAAPILFAGIEPARRLRFCRRLGGGRGARGRASPRRSSAINSRRSRRAAAARRSSSIISRCSARCFRTTLRRVLDVPAYWLILLPIEFPATFIAGTIALVVMLRGAAPGPEKTAVAVFVALAGAGLIVSWLLVSTLGDNNDLGLRAVLPAAMILIVGTAAGMMRSPRRAA